MTREQLESMKSKRGGYTKKILESMGVGWPPPKGWARELTKGSKKPASPTITSQQMQELILENERMNKKILPPATSVPVCCSKCGQSELYRKDNRYHCPRCGPQSGPR